MKVIVVGTFETESALYAELRGRPIVVLCGTLAEIRRAGEYLYEDVHIAPKADSTRQFAIELEKAADQSISGWIAKLGAAREALAPLVAIADAYDANALGDEARKRWGADYEHENQTPPDRIELFHGRGGRCLLTLQQCLDARKVARP